jgi:hypothetical protein
MKMNVGQRSQVKELAPSMPGHGSSLLWHREIGGNTYAFQLATMPDGEKRVAVKRWDGGGLNRGFDAYWTLVHSWTVKPYPRPVSRLTAESLWVCVDCLYAAEYDERNAEADRPELGVLPPHLSVHAGDAEYVEFSRSSCEGCGSVLGGSRHELVLLSLEG